MRSLYSPRRTWLHRLPAWGKLCALSLAGTLMMLTASIALLGGAALVVLLLYLSLGKAAWLQLRHLATLLAVALLIVAFHVHLGTAALGIASALRLLMAALLGLMLTLTTRFDALLDVFLAILQPLQRFGVPTERVALSLGLTLRFAENFLVQWQRLDDAYRARCGKPGGWRLLAPLTVRALQTAERVADALAARMGA
ncbi:MAG: CbiQ family ECF transporter T component [Janthinobacterium lividum]